MPAVAYEPVVYTHEYLAGLRRDAAGEDVDELRGIESVGRERFKEQCLGRRRCLQLCDVYVEVSLFCFAYLLLQLAYGVALYLFALGEVVDGASDAFVNRRIEGTQQRQYL